MEKIKVFIQGFIIGLGKIMPGVSGSVMAISFGVYERIVTSLSSLKELKQNIRFMFIIGCGIALAIVLGSNVIKLLLEYYYVRTIAFFIGMMIPGIFPIIKSLDSKDMTFGRVLISTGVFILLLLISALNFKSTIPLGESAIHESVSLMMCGLLDAFSTIVPGISGTALLMLLGYYERIISLLANLAFPYALKSFITLFPFFIGMIVGIVLTSKLISYIFRRARTFAYMIIISFASFSIITLLLDIFPLVTGVKDILVSSLFLILGYLSSELMNRLFA